MSSRAEEPASQRSPEELTLWQTIAMKAYSRDLRERILAAADAGEPHHRLAARFQVSRATVTRLVRLRRETGGLGPRPRPGQPARLGAALDAGLLPQLRAQPDATTAEHCAAWAQATGQAVSPSTMRRAIARLGWTRKKRA
jgi:transposase